MHRNGLVGGELLRLRRPAAGRRTRLDVSRRSLHGSGSRDDDDARLAGAFGDQIHLEGLERLGRRAGDDLVRAGRSRRCGSCTRSAAWSFWYSTMQSRWVQVPGEGAELRRRRRRTRITGSAPNRTILKPFSSSSGSLVGPASTWLVRRLGNLGRAHETEDRVENCGGQRTGRRAEEPVQEPSA